MKIHDTNTCAEYCKQWRIIADSKRLTVVSILLVFCDVAKGYNVQLLRVISSCRINGKQNRPGNTTTQKTDNDPNPEIPQEEVSVQGVVLQDVAIGQLERVSAKPFPLCNGIIPD
jgi:hypothetical protein